MVLNRRCFLTRGGLGLGGACAGGAVSANLPAALLGQPPTPYERLLAKTEHLAALGLPRSWQSVRSGFHPFSPDRVGLVSPLNRWHRQSTAFGAERMQTLLADWPAKVSEPFWSSGSFLLYVAVSRMLSADYPGAPLETWLTAFVLGEHFYGLSRTAWQWPIRSLGSLTLAHTPRVDNAPVDWWLFLLRKPIEVEGHDGAEQVHVAVGHVFSSIPGYRVGTYLQVAFLGQEFLRSLNEQPPEFAPQLAALDRVSASRRMNIEVGALLERLKNEKR